MCINENPNTMKGLKVYSAENVDRLLAKGMELVHIQKVEGDKYMFIFGAPGSTAILTK